MVWAPERMPALRQTATGVSNYLRPLGASPRHPLDVLQNTLAAVAIPLSSGYALKTCNRDAAPPRRPPD